MSNGPLLFCGNIFLCTCASHSVKVLSINFFDGLLFYRIWNLGMICLIWQFNCWLFWVALKCKLNWIAQNKKEIALVNSCQAEGEGVVQPSNRGMLYLLIITPPPRVQIWPEMSRTYQGRFLRTFASFNFVFVYLSVFKHFTVVAGVGSSLNAHNKRAQV